MFCKLALGALLAASVRGAVSENTEFRLFAYGELALSGLQLVYGDGQAYVGGTPSYCKESLNISLAMTEGESQFVVKTNKTAASASERASKEMMYVDLTEGAANPVGFTMDNKTLPKGASAVGFGLYGGWAFHKQGNADLEMKFLATPTNETGIYLVKWNAASTVAGNDIAIALRTQAPVALENN